MQTEMQGSLTSASALRFMFGAGASALVMFLFENVQVISDLAPAAIRDSAMPGLLGAPVAILAVLWMALIPMIFVVELGRSAFATRQPRAGAFVTGALVSLVAYFAFVFNAHPEVFSQ